MAYNRVLRVRVLATLCSLAGCNFRLDPVDTGSDAGGDGAVVLGDSSVPFAGSDLAGAVVDLAHNGPFLALAVAPTPAAIDLTADGSADWAHWGYAAASDFDHKQTGGMQISSFQSIGLNVPTQYGMGGVIYRWSDGQPGSGRHPMTDLSGTTTGVYVLTGGLKISAPADGATRRLRVYVGQYDAEGRLDASLSDNSAAAVSDHSYTSTNGNAVNVVYDLTYAASSPGQLLTVSWSVRNSSFGNVTLQSASLQQPPL